MKRISKVITAASNKRKSLEAAAQQLAKIYQQPMYEVHVNIEQNRIQILKDNEVATEVTLKTIEKDKQGRKFRRATEEDIHNGLPLYVPEKYMTKTQEQIAEFDEVYNRGVTHRP